MQTPAHTLSSGSGSCRDFATLFLAAARRLGLAARFVSSYLHDPLSPEAGGWILPRSGAIHHDGGGMGDAAGRALGLTP
ncbi:transglutaminase domain-containing protein [Cyanobium sp. NIES-981]|uniref:transglutaminase domain-containing protein n=1 Tax=Cyanobium sp. NIES-981 TaxID=1851505 RepID=UPI0007DD3419|nr:transglutaminase domain-containing protein [Cyanobium sp. NIES-981]SBO42099.1 protein of unknown function [Cyanobium sp. NIES-981]